MVNKNLLSSLTRFTIKCFSLKYIQYRGPRMILGFQNKSRRGRMGNDMRAFSHVKDGAILFMWCVYLPHCVAMSICKE